MGVIINSNLRISSKTTFGQTIASGSDGLASPTWTARSGVSMPSTTVNGFYEYLPTGYGGSVNKPAIIFLHGLSEVGNGTTDLSELIGLALPQKIQLYGFPYDAVVICPQFSTAWPGGFTVQNVINYVRNNYAIDYNKVYLTGLSMGGGSMLDWGEVGTITHIAAMAPLCPASVQQSTIVSNYKSAGMPFWFFHGDADGTVPYTNSTGWISALNGAPSIVPTAQLTTLAGANHNIWNTVYDYGWSIS